MPSLLSLPWILSAHSFFVSPSLRFFTFLIRFAIMFHFCQVPSCLVHFFHIELPLKISMHVACKNLTQKQKRQAKMSTGLIDLVAFNHYLLWPSDACAIVSLFTYSPYHAEMSIDFMISFFDHLFLMRRLGLYECWVPQMIPPSKVPFSWINMLTTGLYQQPGSESSWRARRGQSYIFKFSKPWKEVFMSLHFLKIGYVLLVYTRR